MKTRLIYAVIFCLAMPFAWATSAADFSVEDAYIRTMPPGRTATAGYLYLTNNSDRDCSIIGGSAAIAGTLEIHQQLNSDGMMKMRPVAAVTVTAGETLLFRPGGYHLMLIDVQTELVAGEIHPVSLTTEDCGSIEMDVKVRSLFQKSAPAVKAHDHSKHNHSMPDQSMPDHSMHDHSGHSMQKMKTHGMDK